MRRVIRWGLLIVTALTLSCAGLLGYLVMQMPSPGEARIQIGDDVVGLYDGAAYAWIVLTDHGAVLVDTGMSATAEPIVAELAAMQLSPADVHTVLVTHGHFDHIGGLPAFPDAEVVVGPGEGAMVRGEKRAGGWVPWALGFVMSPPPAPARMREAGDGEVLQLDGRELRVIHTPGHTGGSTVYLYGDTLFTGDSLVGYGDEVGPLPGLFADDLTQNEQSLGKLRDLAFVRIADGHSGLYEGAKAALLAHLGG